MGENPKYKKVRKKYEVRRKYEKSTKKYEIEIRDTSRAYSIEDSAVPAL